MKVGIISTRHSGHESEINLKSVSVKFLNFNFMSYRNQIPSYDRVCYCFMGRGKSVFSKPKNKFRS